MALRIQLVELDAVGQRRADVQHGLQALAGGVVHTHAHPPGARGEAGVEGRARVIAPKRLGRAGLVDVQPAVGIVQHLQLGAKRHGLHVVADALGGQVRWRRRGGGVRLRERCHGREQHGQGPGLQAPPPRWRGRACQPRPGLMADKAQRDHAAGLRAVPRLATRTTSMAASLRHQASPWQGNRRFPDKAAVRFSTVSGNSA